MYNFDKLLKFFSKKQSANKWVSEIEKTKRKNSFNIKNKVEKSRAQNLSNFLYFWIVD